MSSLDLDAYLRRIGYTGDVRPSRAVLDALHLAHATQILFENLDILLGRGVSLDLQDIQAKLVRGGRGGYCFEHNMLFAAALDAVGFTVTRLAARVRYRASQVLPRTHMLLLVDVEGETCVADVGFGAEGLLLPVPFDLPAGSVRNADRPASTVLSGRTATRPAKAGGGRAASQFAWTYRVMDEGRQFVLQSWRNGSWVDLYAFTLEPQHQIDFDVANHYTSTHPQSRFVQTLIVQKLAPEARTSLHNLELVVDRGETVTSRTLAESEILDTLAGTFDLRLPPETRFRVPAASG